ncbi:MAG: hypothetical protein WCT18_03280, partial [Patescibacteria group bacterium]
TGFQGWGQDTELGCGIRDDTNNVWYWNNLNETININGLRLFATVNTGSLTNTAKYFQVGIPQYVDKNVDDVFQIGDIGYFTSGKNNGPSDLITSNSAQYLKYYYGDNTAPKARFTNVVDGMNFNGQNLYIRGEARERGSSGMNYVKVLINDQAYNVTTTDNFATWQYLWNVTTDGQYSVKVMTADNNGNAFVTPVYKINVITGTTGVFSADKTVVSFNKTTGVADNTDKILVTVNLKDGLGNPLKNKNVDFNEYLSTGSLANLKTKNTGETGTVVFEAYTLISGVHNCRLSLESGEIIKDNFELLFTAQKQDLDFATGSWIKTKDSSAVYFLDNSNVRHAYPTLNIWQSYYNNDFSFVKTISSDLLSTYSLGKNVTYKTGTLIKMSSVAKVYKVENGVLRWVKTETAAKNLFGDNWNSLVKVMPESLFPDYKVGENIE